MLSMRCESRTVLDAHDQNVVLKTESSVCSDSSETNCSQIGFLQIENSSSHIKLEQDAHVKQTDWKHESVVKVESNSQDASIKTEQDPVHSEQTEWPHAIGQEEKERSHKVKTETDWPGQDVTRQHNSDDKYQWNCLNATFEARTENSLQNTKGPHALMVKANISQRTSVVTKAGQTQIYNEHVEVLTSNPGRILENKEVQCSSQVEWRGSSGEEIQSCLSSSRIQEMNAAACKNPHQCRICKADFQCSATLERHMMIHSDARSHQCRVCQVGFKQRFKLKQHLIIHSHMIPHQCSVCKAVFKHRFILKKHMVIHSDDKPHQCEVCQAAFRRLTNLKRHMVIHSVVRPHQCSVCKAAFKRSEHLKEHMQIHNSGEKPHQCNVCQANFRRSSALKQHMMIHNDIKPHKCNVCKASFRRSSALKQHILIHGDTRPYQCTLCEAAYKYSSLLKRHMLNHSDVSPHQCSVCKTAFKNSRNLTLHMRIHSDVNPHVKLKCNKTC